jgi:hypothetical protein
VRRPGNDRTDHPVPAVGHGGAQAGPRNRRPAAGWASQEEMGGKRSGSSAGGLLRVYLRILGEFWQP